MIFRIVSYRKYEGQHGDSNNSRSSGGCMSMNMMKGLVHFPNLTYSLYCSQIA